MSEIKLTIDEVIEHCERCVQSYASTDIDEIIAERGTEFTFVKRYLEHKQVAEWLKELKNLRGAMERIVERLEEARAECKELQRSTTDAYGYMKMKQGIDCAMEIVKEEGAVDEG